MLQTAKARAKNGFLTANDIVKRFGLSYQTLNYYTNLGLLSVAKRDGNERLYGHSDVQRQLQTIGRLKEEGYPLRLIARLFAGRVRERRVQRAVQR